MTWKSWQRSVAMLTATGLGIVSMAALGSPALAAQHAVARTAATMTPGIQRLGGGNAPAIAAATARAEYPHGTGTVILAPADGHNLYDPLVSGPLAGALHVPIVLTSTPRAVDGVNAQLLAQWHVHQVILIGADNNARIRKAVTVKGRHVWGIGSTNIYTTATQVAQHLLKATGERAFSSVFIMTGDPAAIPGALGAVSPATSMQSPILLTEPGKNARSTLPPSEAALARQATTAYTLGPTATGTVTNLPATTNVVSLSGPTAWQTNAAIDWHFFYGPMSVFVAANTPAGVAAGLAAAPDAGSQRAPIILASPTSVPAAGHRFLSSLAPGSFTPVAVGDPGMVPNATVQAVAHDAGGTAFAALDAMNQAFFLKGAKLIHAAFPIVPATGPWANGQTMALMNDPSVIATYGGPKLPVSLKAAGISPDTPADQAIIGLTTAEMVRVVAEAQHVSLLNPLPSPTLLAAVRTAARYAIINSGNTGLSTFMANAEDPLFVTERPHLQTSVAQATAGWDKGILPGRVWVYRTWASVAHVTVTANTPPGQPAGHVVSSIAIHGITINMVMSAIHNGRLIIGRFTVPNLTVDLDLIRDGSLTRWYFDNETTWSTSAPAAIYWTGPAQ